MTAHQDYFQYLTGRSRLGKLYRAHWLYPRLVRSLKGRCADIGCGVGDMLTFRPNTVGFDINEYTVGYCQKMGLDARLMQPNALPVGQAEFDSVLLDNVLEHLEQPAPLLAEIRRVLRPEGTLLVGVPGVRGWQSDADHKVFYDEDRLQSCVEAAGFKRNSMLHTPLWKSRWLSEHVRQYCIYMSFTR